MAKSLVFFRSIQAWHLQLVAMTVWAAFSFVSNSILSLHHILAFLAFLVLARSKTRHWGGHANFLLLLFFVSTLVSVVANWSELEKPISKILKAKYLLVGVFSCFIVKNFVEKLRTYKEKLLVLFLLSFFLTVLYALARFAYEYLSLGSVYRPSGFFGMIMSYAYTAIWPVVLCLFLAVNPKVKFTFCESVLNLAALRWVVFLCCLATLCLTQARGAILGFLFCLPFLFLFNLRKFILACCIVLAFAVFGYLRIKDASNDISLTNRVFQGLQSQSNLERLSQFEVAWKAALEKPLFGQGWRSLEERSASIKDRYNIGEKQFVGHAHNNYLEVLATTGILGFVCFVGWFFFWIKDVFWLNKSPWRYFYISGIVGFLVSGLFQSTLIDSEYAFTLFAFFGLTPLFIDTSPS